MSIVNFTSGINRIEQGRPLSEWAIEFIREQNLSRESYTNEEVFRSLSRRQKDAVRYQLRKMDRNPHSSRVENLRIRSQKTTSNSIPKKIPRMKLLIIAKIGLGSWISIFLLFDIVEIYIAKGASSAMAWQATVLVELCIICAAISLKPKLRRVAYVLLTYNVLLFAFMELDQTFIKISNLRTKNLLVAEKTQLLEKMKSKLSEQMAESSNNIRRLDSAHARGYITSGSLAFEKVSQSLKASTKVLTNEISLVEREIQELNVTQHSLFWIYITSLLYFLLRCILQFFSIRLLDRRDEQE